MIDTKTYGDLLLSVFDESLQTHHWKSEITKVVISKMWEISHYS